MRCLLCFFLITVVSCGGRSQLGVATVSTASSTGTGGAAPGGTCRPGDPPAVVAPKTGAYGIVVDETSVYFAGLSSKIVGRVDKVGGTIDILATMSIAPWFLAIDATRVYWTTACGEPECGVFASPETGGATTEIAPLPSGAGIAVDDASVFWLQADVSVAAVWKMTKPAGPAQKLVAGLGHPVGIALDDGFVYWADDVEGTIGRVAKGGGTSELVATTSAGAWEVAADDTRVYWSVSTQAGFVASAPKGGGDPTMLVTNLDHPSGVAVDAENLYVTVQGLPSAGSVLKLPRSGGAPVVVAESQQGPSNLAVDDTCVYWANEDGTIMRAPK
jgi:hypothetical protein